jgi:hypothetical protein
VLSTMLRRRKRRNTIVRFTAGLAKTWFLFITAFGREFGAEHKTCGLGAMTIGRDRRFEQVARISRVVMPS